MRRPVMPLSLGRRRTPCDRNEAGWCRCRENSGHVMPSDKEEAIG